MMESRLVRLIEEVRDEVKYGKSMARRKEDRHKVLKSAARWGAIGAAVSVPLAMSRRPMARRLLKGQGLTSRQAKRAIPKTRVKHILMGMPADALTLAAPAAAITAIKNKRRFRREAKQDLIKGGATKGTLVKREYRREV